MKNIYKFLCRVLILPAFFYSYAANAEPRMAVMVISDNFGEYKMDYQWARTQWGEMIDVILRPKNLDDMARQLAELGKKKKIDALVFMGHGTPGGSQIFFMKGQPALTEYDFNALRHRFPRLPEAFKSHATLQFWNCNVGQNQRLMTAAGRAFMRINGGLVVANNKNIIFYTRRGWWGWGKKYISRVDYPEDGMVKISIAPEKSTQTQQSVPRPDNTNNSGSACGWKLRNGQWSCRCPWGGVGEVVKTARPDISCGPKPHISPGG